MFNAGDAAIQGFLGNFQQLYRNTGIGEGHGDATAHRTGADHRRGVDVAGLYAGGQIGDFRAFAFGEEGVTEGFCLVGIFQFGEEFLFALDAVREGQIAGGFDRQDTVIRRLLVTGAARDGFAHGIEHAGFVAGFLQAVQILADPAQRAFIGNLAGISDGFGFQIGIFRQHFIDDAVGFCLRGGNVAAGDDHFQRALRAGQTRQALCAAAAGQDADGNFRQANFRGRDGDAVVTPHRMFQPAAEGKAMDCGDHRLFTAFQQIVAALAYGRAGARFAELADIRPRDEAAASSDQNDGFYRRVLGGFFQAFDDAFGDAGAEGVDRRVVHHDHAHVTMGFVAHQLCFTHGTSPSVSFAWAQTSRPCARRPLGHARRIGYLTGSR